MKLRKSFLLTAISMAIPASILCAQDNAPQPPPQPPQPPNAPQGLPQGRVGDRQRPEGQPRPDGQRGGGDPRGDGRRGGPSLFSLLDANHDGVIDAEEMKNAPEALKKLDRRGDGRITPDEFFPQFDGRSMRRPQDGNPQQPGQPQPQARPDQPGQPRGDERDGRGDGNRRPPFDQGNQRAPGGNDGRNAQPQGPGPQPGGPGAAPQGPQGRDGGPQAWMQRHQQFQSEMKQRFEREMRERFAGEMQRRQEMAQRFERGRQWQAQNNGPQQPGLQNQGPQAGPGEHHQHWPIGPRPGQQFSQTGPQGPGMEQRHHYGEFGPQQGGQGFAQNGPQFGPQRPWMRHRHHHGEFGPQQGPGFAQNGPQFGPQGPWMHHRHHHGEFGPQQDRGFAQNRPQFGPQMHQGPWMQRGPGYQCGPQGPQDFRDFSHRPPPQDGQREFRPSPQVGPQPGGQFPRPDGRRFDGRGMNPPGPGGPQPENRNPAGNGPQQHHHFHPGVTDNFVPEEGGAAGPQGEPAPEFQQPAPAPNDYGTSAPPPAPGDVI